MADREKVIGELEYCRHNPKCNACEKCQRGGRAIMTCESLVDDAIAMLKEQEPVEPVKWIYPTDVIGFGRCPHCNALWDYSLISNMFFKHCPRCGKKVKWT